MNLCLNSNADWLVVVGVRERDLSSRSLSRADLSGGNLVGNFELRDGTVLGPATFIIPDPTNGDAVVVLSAANRAAINFGKSNTLPLLCDVFYNRTVAGSQFLLWLGRIIGTIYRGSSASKSGSIDTIVGLPQPTPKVVFVIDIESGDPDPGASAMSLDFSQSRNSQYLSI